MHVWIPEAPSLVPVARTTIAYWLKEGTDRWRLSHDWVVFLDGVRYVVPAGYVTDLASTPRWVWTAFPPGRSGARWAAIFHDRCYSHWYHEVTKEFADEAFKQIMLHRGAHKTVAQIYYLSVKFWGKGGWKWKQAK